MTLRPDDVLLAAGDYRLALAPARGGSVSSFTWRDEPLFRATCGDTPLETACFPLVPFSNRVAHGRFYDGDRAVRIAPNFPNSDHPHTLHGFGWLAPWQVTEQDDASATLRHDYPGGEWPWRYTAEQRLALAHDGLRIELSVTNLADTPMPAGLGLHPYLPRTAATLYHGLHTGEWQTTDDGLPLYVDERAEPVDWWHGQPAATRAADTAYAGRTGPLHVTWPDRGLRLAIRACDDLPFTVVYTPTDANYLCVEPVSHATDAVNMRTPASRWRLLAPGARWTVWVQFEASAQ